MRLDHKPNRIEQGRITGGVTRRLIELGKTLVGRVSPGVYVGRRRDFLLLQIVNKCRHHFLFEEIAQRPAQLVVLGHDVGQRILIVGAVAHMVVDKNLGIRKPENLGKSHGVFGVLLDKIAVQVIVAGVSTKAVLLRTVLVDA